MSDDERVTLTMEKDAIHSHYSRCIDNLRDAASRDSTRSLIAGFVLGVMFTAVFTICYMRGFL